MLKRLYIKNFITIDLIDINLPNGFISLTGETGAGKSIILDALHLISGNRLDSSKLNKNEKKIIIECEFDISNCNLIDFFELHSIDYAASTILRREITPNGKSRSFINDSPVKLEFLKLISHKLIDIHSQHENLLLNNEFFQLDFIDNILSNQDQSFSVLLQDYRKEFMKNQRLFEELEELMIKNKLKKDKNEDILLLLNELNDLNLKKGEKVGLLEEYDLLKNSNNIKVELENAISYLGKEDQSVLSKLNIITNSLNKINNYNQNINNFSDRINTNLIDLQDLFREIDIFYDKLDFDQDRLLFIENRLNKINFLEEKHLVSDSDELIYKRDSLLREKLDFVNLEEKIEDLKNDYNDHSEKLFSQAELLSKKRKEAALKIESSLIKD